jgi:hypothetical protein
MLCQSCGKWVPDDFMFCNYCGNRLSSTNPTTPRMPLPDATSPRLPRQSPSTSPRMLRQFAPKPSQQPGESWESGSQQAAGDPAHLPGIYPTNSGSAFPYGTNLSWQDHQSGQASVPDYLSPQTVPPPLPQQDPSWSQPFPAVQPPQQEAFWSQPFPAVQPPQRKSFQSQPIPAVPTPQLPQQEASWSQPFPAVQSPLQEASRSQPLRKNQLRAQASTNGSAPTPNRVQQILIQLFQPSLAANPWLGIIIGGVSPALLGALFFIILSALLHSSSAANGINALSNFDFSPTGIIPMDNAVRDGLQALLTAQGISRHLVADYSATGTSLLMDIDLASPLPLTLLFPALFLVMGGYLAACTDMQNRTLASLWRGAAISLPYMLLLLLLSTQAGGDVPSAPLSPGASSSIFSLFRSQISFTLSINVVSLILLSLLWGVLFGTLGATLKLARGHWRSWLHNFLRHNAHSRLTAILAGGLVAILLGFLFALLLSYTAMAANIQLMQASTCTFGGANGSLTTSDITTGPLVAVQLLAFSFGTPITLDLHASGLNLITNALAAGGCMGRTSFSLFGGMPHSTPWMYLLLLLPVLSLFTGGRVSARLGQPASLGIAAIQGALIAVPFTIAMMILAALSMISFSMDITGSIILNIPETHVMVSLGAGISDVMFWSLLSSAFLGGLGGMYQASSFGLEMDRAHRRELKHLKKCRKPPFHESSGQLSLP